MTPVATVELILGLLVLVALLTALAEHIALPYPIVLVLGGLALALIPGLPEVKLDPGLVFVLFLPPVLYGAAWSTSWRDFWRNKRPILTLAFGLTFFTTAIIALVAHAVIPGITLAGGFVLGAIVSPPDAVAATAIAQRLRLPSRIVTILEGESLVNDAMGLVLYSFAVTAVVTGTFSLPIAVGQFFYSALGGVAAGLALGWMAAFLQSGLRAVSSVEILFTLLTSYAVYILAEAIHVSGVLATVAAGLYSGWLGPERLKAETRIQGMAVWDLVLFLLNGLIFILIGLQLRGVLAHMVQARSWNLVTTPEAIHGVGPLTRTWAELVTYAVIIVFVTIGVRLVWVFLVTYLSRLIPSVRRTDPMPRLEAVLIIGWTGMRGIVTLAAALALPALTLSGAPFPQRDLIIFLAFAVILATLVLQGLSLPPLLRRLALKDDGQAEREEHEARVEAARAALADLEKLVEAEPNNCPPEALFLSFRSRYQQKVEELLRAQFDAEASSTAGEAVTASSALPLFGWIQRLRRAGLEAERRKLIELRKTGRIGDEVMHKLERELDLEESRLA